LQVEGILQPLRQIPDRVDQEIAITAGAEGRFFGGMPSRAIKASTTARAERMAYLSSAGEQEVLLDKS
jgi:hypothetical protein